MLGQPFPLIVTLGRGNRCPRREYLSTVGAETQSKAPQIGSVTFAALVYEREGFGRDREEAGFAARELRADDLRDFVDRDDLPLCLCELELLARRSRRLVPLADFLEREPGHIALRRGDRPVLEPLPDLAGIESVLAPFPALLEDRHSGSEPSRDGRERDVEDLAELVSVYFLAHARTLRGVPGDGKRAPVARRAGLDEPAAVGVSLEDNLRGLGVAAVGAIGAEAVGGDPNGGGFAVRDNVAGELEDILDLLLERLERPAISEDQIRLDPIDPLGGMDREPEPERQEEAPDDPPTGAGLNARVLDPDDDAAEVADRLRFIRETNVLDGDRHVAELLDPAAPSVRPKGAADHVPAPLRPEGYHRVSRRAPRQELERLLLSIALDLPVGKPDGAEHVFQRVGDTRPFETVRVL